MNKLWFLLIFCIDILQQNQFLRLETGYNQGQGSIQLTLQGLRSKSFSKMFYRTSLSRVLLELSLQGFLQTKYLDWPASFFCSAFDCNGGMSTHNLAHSNSRIARPGKKITWQIARIMWWRTHKEVHVHPRKSVLGMTNWPLGLEAPPQILPGRQPSIIANAQMQHRQQRYNVHI